MKTWKILAFALIILVLVVFGIAASYLQADAFINNPPERRHPITESPADYGMDYETVTLTSEDGLHLAGWYVPSRNQGAVILLHGYKSNRTDVLTRAQLLADHGYGVMMIDLRAHGESDGEIITLGAHEARDVEAAYQYLLSRADVDPERIGIEGRSMGGSIALLYAAQNPAIKAVISESGYATLADEASQAVANTGLPFFFAPLVQRFAEQKGGIQVKDVTAVEHIGEISPRPVFIMQGGNDWVVPLDSGQRLYDAAGEPRELWFDESVGHAAFLEECPEDFKTRVVAFFDHYLLKQE